MDEAKKEDVENQEIVKPEETPEEGKAESDQVQEKPPEKSKEYNWRRMEQKVSELERKNHELVDAIVKTAAPKGEEKDELSELDADDIITVRQADKLAEKRARKIIAEELDKRERERLPSQVKAQYKDYDEVVTPENLELLIKEDPDLEYDIKVAKNPHARAYKAIKQASFFKENKTYSEANARIEANSQKPVSSNAIGKTSPLEKANAYVKADPKCWELVQKYRGGSY